MTTHHGLPTADELKRLSARTDNAITIYVPTSPNPRERSVSQVAVKSAFDDAIRRLKQEGSKHALIEQLRAQWQAVDQDAGLWGKLSSSLAIFLAPEVNEVFVLPNQLEPQHQLADYFDLGQLLRSVTFPHEAYAVTLSAKNWSLWHATAEERIAQVELEGDYPTDAAEATHRESIQGRGMNRKLVGDEGKKALLDQYAYRVAEFVGKELTRKGVGRDVPLFVFAADPLLTQFSEHVDRDVIQVAGAADALQADQLDEQVRHGLDQHYARQANAELDRIANMVSAGLVATDLAEISQAATRGLVDTMLFDFTVDIYGRIDETSGDLQRLDAEVTFDNGAPAYDLLSQLALMVLNQGGRVIAVRNSEVSNTVWNSVAVASLRGAIS